MPSFLSFNWRKLTAPIICLSLLWLIFGVIDRTWFALDQAPPAWDQGDHLTKAMHHWRIFQQTPWFTSQWWHELWAQAPTQRAPLAYLMTVPFLAIWGGGYDQATLVNLLWTALLMVALYGWGRHCFDALTGQWAATLVLVIPLLVFQRLDYLLDYPLTVSIAFTYWSFTVWRSRHNALGWQSWGWAIASGLGMGLTLLTRTSGLLFLLPGLFWLSGSTYWNLISRYRQRSAWLQLAQWMLMLLVCGLTIRGWFSQNWLTIISTTIESSIHGITFRGDSQGNTLAGWLFYLQNLPEMVSPLILFGGIGCWLALHCHRFYGHKFSGLDLQAVVDHSAATRRTWRWLWVLTISIYILGSLGPNKQPRLLLPWVLPLLLILVRGMTLIVGHWGQKLRWSILGIGAIWVTLSVLPNPIFHPIANRYPYLGAAYPHQEVISSIISTEPYLSHNLGVVVNTPTLNPMNFDFNGAVKGFQVYGRQLGFRPEQAVQDGKSVNWYITKTGEQGEYATIEAGQQQLKNYVAQSKQLTVVKRWQLPDKSELSLHHRLPAPVEVTPIQETTPLRLTQVILPSQIAPHQPIPVTYVWQGDWLSLQSALVLLDWQSSGKSSGKTNVIHDHAIANGEMFGTYAGGWQVVERMVLPPLEVGNYTLKVRLKSLPVKGYQPPNSINQLLNSPDVILKVAAPISENSREESQQNSQQQNEYLPELDRISHFRQLAPLLAQGKLDPVFDMVGRLNQYDPTQAYLTHAQILLESRLQEQPRDSDLLYSLALVHVLQRHVPEAITTFEQITKVDSQNPYAWAFLAFVNLYNFQPQAAQQALAKVEAINPKLPELRTLKIATAIMQFQFTSALQM